MNSDLRKNQLVTDRLFAKLRIEFEWNYTLHGKNIVIENLSTKTKSFFIDGYSYFSNYDKGRLIN